jgi:hypothetical protein
LPLEFFDDWEAFETRSNAQWLERDAIDAPNGGVRARCAVYPRADRTGFPLWTHCSVVSGDPSVNAYDVRLDKNRKILPNVSRVDLCFDTEDPNVFAARRHAAYVARVSAVAGLRADFYVDNMPAVDSIDSVAMDEDSVARVVAVATNGGSKRFKEWAFDEVPVVRDRASSPAEGGGAEGGADGADDEGAPVETTLRPSAAAAAATEVLVSQVKSEYARAMSRCVFDDAVVKPQHGLGSRVDRRAARGGVSAPAVDADALIEGAPDDLLVEAPETYDLIVRSKPAPIKATAPDMPPYDFTRSFGEFAQSTKLTKVEAYAAEMAIAAENAALLRNYAIFRVLFTKSVKLEEFEGAQKQALQNLCVARDKWIAGVRKHIVDKFKTAGKGWFNLKETDQTAYNYSKLKRFIKTTQLRVEDTLRSLAEANVVAFRDFILEPVRATARGCRHERGSVRRPGGSRIRAAVHAGPGCQGGCQKERKLQFPVHDADAQVRAVRARRVRERRDLVARDQEPGARDHEPPALDHVARNGGGANLRGAGFRRPGSNRVRAQEQRRVIEPILRPVRDALTDPTPRRQRVRQVVVGT